MWIKNAIWFFASKNVTTRRLFDQTLWYKNELFFSILNDERFAEYSYKKLLKKELNLSDPQTFDEKLWYLKIHNRDPLLTTYSDKLLVRDYVRECGLQHILNEQYGAWSKAEDIDFTQLPSPCFLKCNNGSGCNIIYDLNHPFDKTDFIKRFYFALQHDYSKKYR